MEPLRKLIREVHRRSLWQVVGLYLAISWVALQVVETLAESAGLPEWFPTLALALLVIGLPIVVATAFVQEGLGMKPPEPAPQSPSDIGETPPEPGVRAGAESLFTWRNAIGGGVVALALWGLVALGWVFTRGTPPPVGPRAAAATPSEALLPQGEERRKSVAVLPFANLSPDEEDAFFADGVHENILTQLSKVGDLRVLSRASMLRYRDTEKSLREIADEVGAGALLQGSVQRAGDQLRISAQLTDPYTEENLWADQYDGQVSEIFSFQSDVALSVARELVATLSPEVAAAVERRSTGSVTALDFYLQGRQAYDRYQLEDNEEAIRLFRQAIALDSSFALAWAGLADGYLQRVQFFGYPIEWADSGEVMALRGLEIDPQLPEGYKALGFAHSQRGRQRDAIAEWERAVALSPNHHPSINNIGVSHLLLGNQAESLRWFKRAFSLDPNNVLSRTNVATAYAFLGDTATARRWMDEARALTPDNANVFQMDWVVETIARGPGPAQRRLREAAEMHELDEPRTLAALADGAMLLDDAEAAARYSREALDGVPEGGTVYGWSDARVVRAWSLSRQGMSGEALEILANVERELEMLERRGADDAFTPYALAQVHAIRGARDDALSTLEEAFGRGAWWIPYFDLDPIFDGLRDEPRIAGLRAAALEARERDLATIVAEERAAGIRP